MRCNRPVVFRALQQMRRRFFAACALSALACLPVAVFAAKSDPWAEIKVGGVAEGTQDEYDVMLIAVNGSRDVPSKALYEFAPGTYQLRIASRKRGKSGETVSLPFAIDMQPCTRYAMIADHQQESEGRKWRIAIKSETEVEPCMKKFGATLLNSTQTAATP